ncbi:MAG TPA: non-homologous end-joining DNA ligase, partial [Bacteroidales bacterium]|nr:non-homologous end-joining DNA ligase [Bacteroidales bacterium]
TNPEIRRLAMMVEDHPYDYHDFEGIIPEGEYGGGTVIVWDEGTYEDAELVGKPKKEQEKSLLDGLYSGKVKIVLQGKKLKGRYALIKAKDKDDNSWFFMKMKDEEASPEDITLKDKSVLSGKNIEQVKRTSRNIYGAAPGKKKKKVEKGMELSEDVMNILKEAPDNPIPENIKPMLATLVDKPFDDEGWLFEVKWDGYRAISFVNDRVVKLQSRNNKEFTEKYYPVSEALRKWRINAVVDGEIVVLNEKGVSDFSALQNWRSEADGELVMYVFDLLWFEGKNLMKVPLVERYKVLEEVFPSDDDRIRLSETFENGIEFFSAAEKLGLEGIIAKRSESQYIPDNRSKSWLKIKVHKRQEVVIGGYTLNEGSDKLFSSLLLGVFENGSLRFVGKVGTGFNEKLQRELMNQFKPLVVSKSPFSVEPDVNQPSRFRPDPPKAKAIWLKPELVCEVSFTEITDDGVFRHPSFKGMRSDKKPEEVIMETEKKTEAVVDKSFSPEKEERKGIIKPLGPVTRKTLLNPTEET